MSDHDEEPRKKRKARRGRGEGSVEKMANGTYRAVLSLGKDADGRRIKRKFYGKTKKEALRKLREAQGQHDRGVLADPGRQSVGEWLDKWLELKKGKVGAATYRRYEQSVRYHLKPHVGAVPLGKFAALHVEQLYSSMEKASISRGEQRRAGGVLSNACRHAARLHLIHGSPCGDVRKPRAGKREIKPLTAAQVRAFLTAAESDRLYAMYVFWFDSGCRPGEVFGLLWPALDLDAGTARITRALEEVEGRLAIKDTKTTKGNRTIVLAPSTVAQLRQHRERMRAEGRNVEAGPVFCDTRGQWLRQSNLQRRSFNPALSRGKLPRVRPYDIRHTTATLLLQAGVNIKVVSERLGHSTVQITLEHYSHVMPGMQNLAASAMESILQLSPSCPPGVLDFQI